MNKFKPAQVIMLPTENENQGVYLNPVPSSNKIHYRDRIISNSYIAQHLYIISDDEIKEGDWFIGLQNQIIKATIKDIYGGYEKKIIATTDTSLRIYYPCIQCDGTGETVFSGTYTTQKKCDLCSQLKYPNTKALPQPSQQFIEQYIESYNKGEVITDVLVEYEDNLYEHFGSGKYWEDKPVMMKKYLDKDDTYIKINSKDNTITIKKLKDNWSREEVISNIIKHRNDFLKFKTDSHYNPNDKEIKEWEDNWIKENL